MNFIEDFIQNAKKITDAPDIYLKATAYFCTSFLFGVNVECLDSRIEKVNTWFMLSGAPAITRKSTTINTLGAKFCKLMLENSLKSKFGINDREASNLAEMMFFESGTTEGIADHLSITNDMPEIDRYALISAEFGGVLKSVSRKDYLVDLFSFLSKLYYGESGKVLLSARGKKSEDRVRYIPAGLYVCALIGLQDLHLYFDPIAIKQGFARRFIIIHVKPSSKERQLPPIDPAFKAAKLSFKHLIHKYTSMFDNYNDSSPILVVFDQKSRETINKVWKKCESEYISDPDNTWLLYRQTLWEHLYKLSVLEAIARTPKPQVNASGTKVINVKIDDVKRAFQFLSSAMESAREIFTLIDASPKQSNLMLRTGEIRYVKELIYSAGNKGITKSDLLRKSGLTSKQLDELLITLMQSEEISCYIQNTSGRGKKRFVFFFSGNEPSTRSGFEYVSVDVYKTLVR